MANMLTAAEFGLLDDGRQVAVAWVLAASRDALPASITLPFNPDADPLSVADFVPQLKAATADTTGALGFYRYLRTREDYAHGEQSLIGVPVRLKREWTATITFEAALLNELLAAGRLDADPPVVPATISEISPAGTQWGMRRRVAWQPEGLELFVEEPANVQLNFFGDNGEPEFLTPGFIVY